MELSKSIQIFYKKVIESSSDEESDDDSELMMATSTLLHKHTLRLVYRGSVKGHKANVKRNREKATTNSIATTSILPRQSSMQKKSDAATGCERSCS
jgi:hypothetical protein